MPPARPSRMPRRAHRRRLVALVAVGALASIAATCQAAKPPAPPPPPPPPSVYCHNTTPTSAAQYQAAFDGLRAANTAGWVANDGGLPVNLGNGRVLWMFGDTLIGAPPSGPVNLLGIANNGFVVQQGNCFTPMTEPIPDPGPERWIWPTGAVVEGNVLRVFGLHMRRTQAAPPFNFALVSLDVTTFSLPGLDRLGPRQSLPFPTTPSYGETVVVQGEYVYAYGQKRDENPIPDSFPIPTHYVARAKIGSVLTGPWEFWEGPPPSGDVWVPNQPVAAMPMVFDNPDDGNPVPTPLEGPLAGFAVGHNGGYVGSSFMIDVFSNDGVWSWDSTAPQGPWTRRPTPAVDVSHQNLHPDRHFAYGGRVVFNVPGSSPIGLWSTNHKSFNAVLANPNLYKVWFAPPG